MKSKIYISKNQSRVGGPLLIDLVPITPPLSSMVSYLVHSTDVGTVGVTYNRHY